MTMQQTRTCEKCGGTITAEEIIQRRAGLVEKKLLCVACVDALRRQVAMARAASAQKVRDAEERALRAAEEQAAREAEEQAAREAEARAREAEERAAREAAELAAREQAEAEAAIRAAEEAALTALAAEAAMKPALEEEEYTEAAAEEPVLEPTFESEIESVVREPHAMNGTRCLIFDAEPSSSGIAELQMRINRWLAEHPDAVVRSSSTTVGPCDGAAGGTRFFVTMFF